MTKFQSSGALSADRQAFSTKVRIELHIGGRCLPVAQSGGGQLIFDEPMTLPGGIGELVMHIDESPHRWRVTLRPGSEPSRIVPADFEYLS